MYQKALNIKMRLFELKNRLKSRPIVYVDMDGVLADFFGEVARDHGKESFDQVRRKEISIHQSAHKPNFIANLPKMPHADQLLSAVTELAGEYSILSSPVQSAVEDSSEQKSRWLETQLDGKQPRAVIYDHEKFHYAQQPDETPNILIDDWDYNIKLWQQHGGIGILHSDDNLEQTIAQLKQALERPESMVQPVEDRVPKVMETAEKLFTPLDVLGYIKGLHHKYRLDDPIRRVKVWTLIQAPTSHCNTPEYYNQDDAYHREIDLDWDHIKNITVKDIMTKPAVVDADGWVLDGNHRVTAARLHGLDSIPLIVPAA